MDVGYDAFQNLDLRAEESLQIGYHLWSSPRANVTPLIGAARVDSFYEDNSPDAGYFSLTLGWDFDWNIWKGVTLKNNFKWLPSLENSDEYLMQSKSTAALPLAMKWDLQMNHHWTYNSKPVAPTSSENSTLNLTLARKF